MQEAIAAAASMGLATIFISLCAIVLGLLNTPRD
jgi:hypothetical protein